MLVGWFARRNRSGTAVRTGTTAGLDSAGAALADIPVAANVGQWVGANLRWLRVAVGLLGLVVLVWGTDITVPRFFWSLTLVLVLLALLQVLTGTANRRHVSTTSATPGPGGPSDE